MPTNVSIFDDEYTKWLKFHRANPLVYNEYKRLVRQLVRNGVKRVSSLHVLGYIRMNQMLQVDRQGDDYKVNNNYAPFYSRLLVRECPELFDYFEFRKTQTI